MRNKLVLNVSVGFFLACFASFEAQGKSEKEDKCSPCWKKVNPCDDKKLKELCTNDQCEESFKKQFKARAWEDGEGDLAAAARYQIFLKKCEADNIISNLPSSKDNGFDNRFDQLENSLMKEPQHVDMQHLKRCKIYLRGDICPNPDAVKKMKDTKCWQMARVFTGNIDEKTFEKSCKSYLQKNPNLRRNLHENLGHN